MRRIRVVDSHTEGEPTRVVVSEDLGLGQLPPREALAGLREHDWLRSGSVCEPRGHEAVVGALLCAPEHGGHAGVVYFNNVGYLGMCGHGTIGLVRTLEHLGRIPVGDVTLDTPVGRVTATLHPDSSVTIRNVPSYRYRSGVEVDVPGYGTVVGDIAYGGNWFFLASAGARDLCLNNLDELSRFTTRLRGALEAGQITGAEGAIIDHIELFGPPLGDAHSRNFVLCPGLAYDRSPCGTGLSAKLACLAAEGKLEPGVAWRQESVIGSTFIGTYEATGERGPDGPIVLPSVTGQAWITAESTLVFEASDPFREGIHG